MVAADLFGMGGDAQAPDASGSGIPNAAAVVRNRCSTGRVSVPSSSLTNIEEPRYHSTTPAQRPKVPR